MCVCAVLLRGRVLLRRATLWVIDLLRPSVLTSPPPSPPSPPLLQFKKMKEQISKGKKPKIIGASRWLMKFLMKVIVKSQVYLLGAVRPEGGWSPRANASEKGKLNFQYIGYTIKTLNFCKTASSIKTEVRKLKSKKLITQADLDAMEAAHELERQEWARKLSEAKEAGGSGGDHSALEDEQAAAIAAQQQELEDLHHEQEKEEKEKAVLAKLRAEADAREQKRLAAYAKRGLTSVDVGSVKDIVCPCVPVFSLSLSLSHAHTHTHTRTYTHTHSLFLPLGHAHTLTHTLTHTHSLSLTHAHTHTHARAGTSSQFTKIRTIHGIMRSRSR